MAVLTENQKKKGREMAAELAKMMPSDQNCTASYLRCVSNSLSVLLELLDEKRTQLTAAEKMHQGCFAESHIEEVADTLWPDMVGRVGADHYDNSLELYFIPDAPDTTLCTEAQAKEILNLGFSQFWLNFCDGTEQHVADTVKKGLVIGQRQKAGLPRGGVRQSMLRSRLYAEIDRLEKQVKTLETATGEGLYKYKFGLLQTYLESGPMTKSDFLQLMQST